MRDDVYTALEAQLDHKQAQILRAAWESFAQYGVRKSSMQDIARAAGMSRPALYLHYRNKDDIFRALARSAYDLAEAQIAEALQANGSVREVLTAALGAQGGTLIETMLTSPHAEELIQVSNQIASDIWMAGEARLRDLYADWLTREAKAGRVTLSVPASEMAEVITWSMKGLKSAGFDAETYRARVVTLAGLVADGLMRAA